MKTKIRTTAILLSVLSIFLAGSGAARGQALDSDSMQDSPILYATDVGTGPGAQLSALYIIDPFTGLATVAWQFAGIHIYAGGLAYDSATDMLYASGVLDSNTASSRLFIIDRFTGAWSALPGNTLPINFSFGGLAINPLDGVMYATGDDGQAGGTALFRVDKTTGVATSVGHSGISLYGLGFRSDGILFANGTPPIGGNSHLYVVNLATGAASDIGPHGVSVGRQLNYSGLAFGSDGTLYSLGSTKCVD